MWCATHTQAAPAPSAASRGTLADHLAAAHAGGGGGDAVDPTAAFSTQRFADYNARVDAQMEARRAADRYDSDEERDPQPAPPAQVEEMHNPHRAHHMWDVWMAVTNHEMRRHRTRCRQRRRWRWRRRRQR